MKQSTISIIVAMAANRVIGKDNAMPWHLPADLKHFQAMTIGKPIIMGRKTYESIGRPLPKRQNIVISSNPTYTLEGCVTVTSLEAALDLVKNEEEIMIIGGANLYNQAIDKATKLYLTFIDLDVEGDTYFPEYKGLNFKELQRTEHTLDEKNPYNYTFVEYVKE